MAHGLPDYYRGVDIAYQALGEMIVRPKYGGAQSSVAAGGVTASVITGMLSIDGKGMTYGGVLLTEPAATQKDSVPIIVVDGELLTAMSFCNLSLYNIDKSYAMPWSLLVYDEVNFKYCVAIAYGITFETSLLIGYHEKHARTPDVEATIHYALI